MILRTAAIMHMAGVMSSRYLRIAWRCLRQLLDGLGFSPGTAWGMSAMSAGCVETAYIVSLLEPAVAQTCCSRSPYVRGRPFEEGRVTPGSRSIPNLEQCRRALVKFARSLFDNGLEPLRYCGGHMPEANFANFVDHGKWPRFKSAAEFRRREFCCHRCFCLHIKTILHLRQALFVLPKSPRKGHYFINCLVCNIDISGFHTLIS
jgi:hypothetical protein